MIPFNKSFLSKKSHDYALKSMESNFHVGDGPFTNLCQNFFKEKFGFKHALLTTSCTHALEMCALLLDFKKGDEIIMPSYTFVSCANAFIREGARVIFCDSNKDSPNMDLNHLENLINPNTKAVLAVHYGGASCDMERLAKIVSDNDLLLIEDAAQA
ncbi:MAG: aminotransferase class I/II-fold pyridoxal phosphate-dependent enzyme, partial [Candidatus Woesearchaeota archaeon]